MTLQEKIDDLQDKVSKNYITNIEELKKYEPEIDVFNDVLSNMEWNICDRCGDLHDSQDFCWVDGFPFEEDNEDDQAILRAIASEGIDYCAVCWKCIKELKNKGKGEQGND